MENKPMISVELKNIKRVLAKPGEIGFEIGLHHYYLLSSAEVKLFDEKEPMAIINVNPDPSLSVVGFCYRKWYDNIETLAGPPGEPYELMILSFCDADHSYNEGDLQ